MEAKPTYWAAILSLIHLLTDIKESSEMLTLQNTEKAIEICCELESKIWPNASLHAKEFQQSKLSMPIPLSEMHQAQTFFLCEGRILMGLKRPKDAIIAFAKGIELILTQPPSVEDGTPSATYTLSEVMLALYCHVCWQWVEQAGSEGSKLERLFAAAVTEISDGKIAHTTFLMQTMQ